MDFKGAFNSINERKVDKHTSWELNDKCHMIMGIFIDLDSILGLICIILRIMHIFLRLRSVLACLGF